MRLIDAEPYSGKVIASHCYSGVNKLINIDDVPTVSLADHDKRIRADAIDEELQEFAQWLWDSQYLVDEAFTIRLVEQYKTDKRINYKHIKLTKEDITNIKTQAEEAAECYRKKLGVGGNYWNRKIFEEAILEPDNFEAVRKDIEKKQQKYIENFELSCICEMALLYLEEHQTFKIENQISNSNSMKKREEIIETYHCYDIHGELCGSCNECKKILTDDIDEFEKEIRADERAKVIDDVIENIIPTLYEHNAHQVTIDNVKRLLEQLKDK